MKNTILLLVLTAALGATASVASKRLDDTLAAFVTVKELSEADKSGLTAYYVAAYRRFSIGQDADVNKAITRAIADFIIAAETMPSEARTKALDQLKSKLKLDDSLRAAAEDIDRKTLDVCLALDKLLKAGLTDRSAESARNVADGAKTAADYRARRRALWL